MNEARDFLADLPSTLIGTFAIRNQGNGCLFSKFVNTVENRAMVESLILIPGSEPAKPSPFEGSYESLWLQGGGAVTGYTVSIVILDDARYGLRWTRPHDVEYMGIAMIFENFLVGAYWIR